MIITRRYEIDMGHCLPDHEGKCYRPHGHRYVIEATCASTMQSSGPESGMVLDFGRLKGLMAHVLDGYDHRFIMSTDDPRADAVAKAFSGDDTTFPNGDDSIIIVSFPPTVEHLARVWAAMLDLSIEQATGARMLRQLRVYETPNCWADHVLPPRR